jgi:hypothetical protein
VQDGTTLEKVSTMPDETDLTIEEAETMWDEATPVELVEVAFILGSTTYVVGPVHSRIVSARGETQTRWPDPVRVSA